MPLAPTGIKDWNHRGVVLTDGGSSKALAYVLGRNKYIRFTAAQQCCIAACKTNTSNLNIPPQTLSIMLLHRIWDLLRGSCVRKFKVIGGRPTALAVTGDGCKVVTCDDR